MFWLVILPNSDCEGVDHSQEKAKAYDVDGNFNGFESHFFKR